MKNNFLLAKQVFIFFFCAISATALGKIFARGDGLLDGIILTPFIALGMWIGMRMAKELEEK